MENGEQLTFEFEQRPTIKGLSRTSLDGQAALPLHAVLPRTIAGDLWSGAERPGSIRSSGEIISRS